LHRAWAVRLDRMKERTPRQATRISGRIVRAPIATDRIVGLVASVRIVNDELRVIEDIENFGAEFQRAAFGYFEVFQERHVEVEGGWGCSGSCGLRRRNQVGRSSKRGGTHEGRSGHFASKLRVSLRVLDN